MDSLKFDSSPPMMIGETGDIKTWREYILIADKSSHKVWAFDGTLKFIQSIGRNGRGPNEFSSAPRILYENHKLWLADKTLRRISEYNERLEYVKQYELPREYGADAAIGIRVGNSFVFNGQLLEKPITQENIQDLQPLIVFDSVFQNQKGIWRWDQVYKDESLSAYTMNQPYIYLCNRNSAGFYAQQMATYEVSEFGENLKLTRTFGLQPKYWRQPPNTPYMTTQQSIEDLSTFIGSCTTYLGICYDEANHHVIMGYANLSKEYFFERSLLRGRHFLQAYDNQYDCVFDGEIPGKLAFVRHGNIYVLTDERPEFIRLLVFKLEKQ